MLTLASLPPTTVRSHGEKCVVAFAVVVPLAVVVAVLNPVLNFFQLGIFLICLLYIKNLLLPLLFASASAYAFAYGFDFAVVVGFSFTHNTCAQHTYTHAHARTECSYMQVLHVRGERDREKNSNNCTLKRFALRLKKIQKNKTISIYSNFYCCCIRLFNAVLHHARLPINDVDRSHNRSGMTRAKLTNLLTIFTQNYKMPNTA